MPSGRGWLAVTSSLPIGGGWRSPNRHLVRGRRLAGRPRGRSRWDVHLQCPKQYAHLLVTVGAGGPQEVSQLPTSRAQIHLGQVVLSELHRDECLGDPLHSRWLLAASHARDYSLDDYGPATTYGPGVDDYGQRLTLSVAAEIEMRRRAAKMSLEALADAAGLHRTSVGLIVRGKRGLTIDVAARLSVVLKAPLSELVLAAERSLEKQSGSASDH